MAENTLDQRKRAYDPQFEISKKVPRRTLLKQAAAVVGLGVASGVAVEAAIQTGAAQKALETTAQAAREALRPKPVEVYVGNIVIPLRDVNIRGQTRVTNPFQGDVLPQNVKKYNSKQYNRERFMVVTNGTVVEGETPKGKPGGKWLEIKIDDGNPTGEYYAYMSLSEETEQVLGKLDQDKFQRIRNSNKDSITLQDGTTLDSQQVNITSFK